MRILLPFDFSNYSINAFDYAVNLAEKLNASLEVFNVFDITTSFGSHTAQEWRQFQMDLSAGRISKMEKLLMEPKGTVPIPKAKDVKIDFTAAVGDPRKILVEKVNNGEYGYVVMGTKGADAVANADPFGSVTTYVMDRIDATLLAIPLTAKYKNFDNILVAEDLDKDDEEVLRKVFDLADQFNSSIAILHISELKDYNNITRKLNYGKIKHNYARTRENIEYIFEKGMNQKVDTLERVAKSKTSDVLVLICRDRKDGFRGINGLTKAVLAQLEIPIMTFHTGKV